MSLSISLFKQKDVKKFRSRFLVLWVNKWKIKELTHVFLITYANSVKKSQKKKKPIRYKTSFVINFNLIAWLKEFDNLFPLKPSSLYSFVTTLKYFKRHKRPFHGILIASLYKRESECFCKDNLSCILSNNIRIILCFISMFYL